MRKINYITSDEWWDTDVDILRDLVRYYEVSVYVLSPAPKRAKFPIKRVEGCSKIHDICYHFRKRNPLCAIFFLWYFFISIVACYKKGTITFCLNGWHPFLTPFFYCFLPKDNTIISNHNYLSHNPNEKQLNVLFYRKFKLFHFHSEAQQLLFKKDFPEKKCFFSKMPPKNLGNPNGLYKVDKSKTILLFFGLIRDYKRLDLLINAVNQLPEENFKVIIAGYTNDFAKYKKMIKDESKFQLQIRFISNEEIPDLFTVADFLVLPYDDATQSGPSLIALNYGLPIIASDQPSFKAMIKDGENGFLFDKGNVNSLEKVLKKVAQLSKIDIAKLKKKQIKIKESYLKMNAPHQAFESFISSYFS